MNLVHTAQPLHDQYDRRLGGKLVDQEIRFEAAKFVDAHMRSHIGRALRRCRPE